MYSDVDPLSKEEMNLEMNEEEDSLKFSIQVSFNNINRQGEVYRLNRLFANYWQTPKN